MNMIRAYAVAVIAIGLMAVAPYAPLSSVANVATLKANNFAGLPQITLRGYYSASDGGEGPFTYFAGSCTEDGGYVIKDGAANCFRRANLNGNLRQYGVTSGSVYDWLTHGVSSTDITPVLTAAGTAVQSLKMTTLDTSGVSVYMATSYSQPANLTVTCDQTVGVPKPTEWYDALPGAVYEAHGVIWNRAGRTTSVHHCYIAPWFLVAGEPVDAQTTSVLVDAMISNGDTGLVCDQRSCTDHDLMIVGFDTDYEVMSGSDNVVSNMYLDGDVCGWMTGTGGNSRWSAVQCFTFLTQSSPGKEQDFNLTKIESGSGGVCHVTVTPQTGANLTDLAYANYIYTTHLNGASSACEGQWKITNLNTGTGTFDLIGSAVAGPTTFGHWAAGSKVIYVSDGTNISNDEVINGLDAQGIPTGTTVQTNWPLPTNTNGYITDTGGAANTYVANDTPTDAPCKLGDVLNVAFTAAHTNTGASTLNITLNSASGCTGGTTGAIAIVRQDGSALNANDIIAAKSVLVRYSSTLLEWVIVQPKVVLSAATTLAQTSNHTITFNGSTCGNPTPTCGASAEALFLFSARVDAGASAGGVAAGGTGFATGFLIGGPLAKQLPDSNKVAGFQADQLFAYDHSIELHIQNSNETGVTNFGTDSHGNDDNPNVVILLADGETNNAHIIGRKAGKGGRSVQTNITYPDSPDRGCVSWESAAVASNVGFLPVIDVEQGCFTSANAVTNSQGVNLISNFANKARFDVYQPNVTNYYEGPAAMAATWTLGASLTQGQSNPTLIANLAPTATTTTTIDTSAQFWPCDATSGNVAMALPDATLVTNLRFHIQKIDSSANACVISTAGGQTLVGGLSAYYLYAQGQELIVSSNGTTSWAQ